MTGSLPLSRRAALLAMAAAMAVAPAAAQTVYQSGLITSRAIGGYDPVAYFTQSRPVEGSADFEADWNGAIWRFASAANRDAFVATPEAFAPQYGGYCAYAVANGQIAKIDPEAWRIVDGKLYLNYSTSVQARWASDIAGNISRAEANWPDLRKGLGG